MRNKVVLITGSSNGIGRETAFQFASENAKVIITYCNDRLGGRNTKKGRPPEEVTRVVLSTAKGRYRKSSGSDINVWDYDK